MESIYLLAPDSTDKSALTWGSNVLTCPGCTCVCKIRVQVLWEFRLCEFSIGPFPKSELAYLPLVPNSQICCTTREKEHLEFRVNTFCPIEILVLLEGMTVVRNCRSWLPFTASPLC